MPRLIETETATRDMLERSRYVTLSHCWGQQNLTKTTRNNLKERMIGIPWDELSKTFQDAMTLTRRIKCNFIWIDSLCIVQGDDDGDDDDWKEQASKWRIYIQIPFSTSLVLLVLLNLTDSSQFGSVIATPGQAQL